MSRQHHNSARRKKRDAAKRRQREERRELKATQRAVEAASLDTLLEYAVAGVPYVHRGSAHLSAVVVTIHTECIDHWPLHLHEVAVENGLGEFAAEEGEP